MWTPSFPAEAEETASDAAARIGDERAGHFWDAEGSTRESYKRVMKTQKLARDAYFVYGRDAEWKDEPPAPDYYAPQFDGDKLAAELNRLLRPPG